MKYEARFKLEAPPPKLPDAITMYPGYKPLNPIGDRLHTQEVHFNKSRLFWLTKQGKVAWQKEASCCTLLKGEICPRCLWEGEIIVMTEKQAFIVRAERPMLLYEEGLGPRSSLGYTYPKCPRCNYCLGWERTDKMLTS